jgi:hypothetical protein
MAEQYDRPSLRASTTEGGRSQDYRGRARLGLPRSARLDLADVKGQESAERAFEIVAAGGDNLLMVEPIKPVPA